MHSITQTACGRSATVAARRLVERGGRGAIFSGRGRGGGNCGGGRGKKSAATTRAPYAHGARLHDRKIPAAQPG